ncbi:hypothetical protein IJ096_00145 [Candidatus Saccharibacteria bacterium]|nr:hypothetical protein [Candidatus Saccharibacteria bacterium]
MLPILLAKLLYYVDFDHYEYKKSMKSITGEQLEILTHQEAPFIATEPNQDIDYELAFYRGTNFNELATA